MSAHCCHHEQDHHGPGAHRAIPAGLRRALWIALAVNALMFMVEVGAGVTSGSVSLLADAIDFFADAGNYGVTLAVLSLGAAWRSGAAIGKAVTMLLFAALVLGRAVWAALAGVPPEPLTMGVVGALALGANVGVAVLLYAFREGDANMRSVWLCTRNDAIGNAAVLLAALGVFGTGTAWPDLIVAAVMASLAASAAWTVLRLARRELAWNG
jgi:Co/Zn/Cd efflux system component